MKKHMNLKAVKGQNHKWSFDTWENDGKKTWYTGGDDV